MQRNWTLTDIIDVTVKRRAFLAYVIWMEIIHSIQ